MVSRLKNETLPEYVHRVLRLHFAENRHFDGIVDEYLEHLSEGTGNLFVAESSRRWFADEFGGR